MTSDSNDDRNAVDWESTTWKGHRRRQLDRWPRLSLDEILEAQEVMAELARGIAFAQVRPAPRT